MGISLSCNICGVPSLEDHRLERNLAPEKSQQPLVEIDSIEQLIHVLAENQNKSIQIGSSNYKLNFTNAGNGRAHQQLLQEVVRIIAQIQESHQLLTDAIQVPNLGTKNLSHNEALVKYKTLAESFLLGTHKQLNLEKKSHSYDKSESMNSRT